MPNNPGDVRRKHLVTLLYQKYLLITGCCRNLPCHLSCCVTMQPSNDDDDYDVDDGDDDDDDDDDYGDDYDDGDDDDEIDELLD